eukprot:gene10716-7447_t
MATCFLSGTEILLAASFLFVITFHSNTNKPSQRHVVRAFAPVKRVLAVASPTALGPHIKSDSHPPKTHTHTHHLGKDQECTHVCLCSRCVHQSLQYEPRAVSTYVHTHTRIPPPNPGVLAPVSI